MGCHGCGACGRHPFACDHAAGRRPQVRARRVAIGAECTSCVVSGSAAFLLYPLTLPYYESLTEFGNVLVVILLMLARLRLIGHGRIFNPKFIQLLSSRCNDLGSLLDHCAGLSVPSRPTAAVRGRYYELLVKVRAAWRGDGGIWATTDSGGCYGVSERI